MYPAQYEKRSTPEELNEFLKSNIYKDFTAILADRIQAVQNDLSMADSMDTVRRLQGELQGLRFWEVFPAALTKAILEEKEDATEATS